MAADTIVHVAVAPEDMTEPTKGQSRNWGFTRYLEGNELDFFTGHPQQQEAGPVYAPIDGHLWDWHKKAHVKYVSFQVELCPETRRLHVQGFVHLDSSRKLAFVKTLIGNNPHCWICKDVAASIKYTQKEESRYSPRFWEYGSKPEGQGQRKDLQFYAKEVIDGKRPSHVMLEDLRALKYSKFLKEAAFIGLEARSDRTRLGKIAVFVLWGPTDTGKSWAAMKLFGADGDYFKVDCAMVRSRNAVWFDGYEGQKTLIIDDFDSTLFTPGYLKNILDVYKQRLEIKGSHTWACWETVVITSNHHPHYWFPGILDTDYEAVVRRFTEIRHYTERGTWKRQSAYEEYLDTDFSQDIFVNHESLAPNGRQVLPIETADPIQDDPMIPDDPFEDADLEAFLAAMKTPDL